MYHSLNASIGSAHGFIAGVSGPVTAPSPEAAACKTSLPVDRQADGLAHPHVGEGLPAMVDMTMSKPSRGPRMAVSRLSSFTSR